MNNIDLLDFIAKKLVAIIEKSNHKKSLLFSSMNNAQLLCKLEELHKNDPHFSGWIVFNSWGWGWHTSFLPRPNIKEDEELYYVEYNKYDYVIDACDDISLLHLIATLLTKEGYAVA